MTHTKITEVVMLGIRLLKAVVLLKGVKSGRIPHLQMFGLSHLRVAGQTQLILCTLRASAYIPHLVHPLILNIWKLGPGEVT